MSEITVVQRDRLQHVCSVAYAHRSLYGYIMQRPYATWGRTWNEQLALWKKGVKTKVDCSAFIISNFGWAGLRDPSGYGFNGDGNTQTILETLPHFTDWARTHFGSLIVYTDDSDDLESQHGAMIYTPDGDNPWVLSHGGDNGPIMVRHQALLAALPGRHAVLCAIQHLG